MELRSLHGPTNFLLVSHMNNAFNNPKGHPDRIDWDRIAKQCLNVADELAEIFVAMGADKASARLLAHNFKNNLESLRQEGTKEINLDGVRDGLCDVHVFTYGAHHLMGIDADADMQSCVNGVMTRFIKDDEDLKDTVIMHASKGVVKTYLEGEFPTKVLKSAEDQPDAPKGKFLKSASYQEPVYYKVT